MNTTKITLFLTCYQQEPYIKEAVQSALAQDYSPLEILISDDCSSDRTFEIINEVCQDYDGPHEVIINQTKKNIGAANHTNELIPLATGELIVIGCGDDIFTPNRVSVIAEVWHKYKTPVITSNAYRMTADGNVTGVVRSKDDNADLTLEHFLEHIVNIACYGATQAFEKKLFMEFGPMDTSWSPYNGDHIIPFWGLLSGGNSYIFEPLVYHRMAPKSDSWKNHSISTTQEERNESVLTHHIAQCMYILHTLEKFIETNNLSSSDRYVNCKTILTGTLIRLNKQWIKTRNSIKLKGKQCQWVALE